MATGGSNANIGTSELWSSLPFVTSTTGEVNQSQIRTKPGDIPRQNADGTGPLKLLSEKECSKTKEKNNSSDSDVDWSESAQLGVHIWCNAESSGQSCSIPDEQCTRSGAKQKCCACKMVIHKKCMQYLEKLNFACKITFRQGSMRHITEEERHTGHHWVYQRKYHGKCTHCSKSFHNPRNIKDIVAVSCSWCKCAYHYNNICAVSVMKEDYCTLGVNSQFIVPPSWVVKLPIRRFRNSSIKKKSSKKRSAREEKAFAVRPEINHNKSPLLVFINPKSGGKLGGKIIRKFQWLLNPRQVFDLSKGGPKFGLHLYRKVQNLRIIACGGDGTVGWILSELDSLELSPSPPVAVLPLGTGNDLSRILNWGGGYTDEPIDRILQHLKEAEHIHLDRWNLDVSENLIGEKEKEDGSVENLPLNVMNNYFSIGADAEVTLEFHESREANPDRFTNRLYSLYFYGKAGGRTVIQRRSKDLFRYIKLECDGVDLTPRIKELKPQCLLFLNIPSYGAGTSPWGNPLKEYEEFRGQSCDDGYLEVIGLTSTSMATTRVGGHGCRIYQCQNAVVKTSKSLPAQVDGEPCRLLPSVIKINLRNQANMLKKIKKNSSRSNSSSGSPLSPVVQSNIKIFVIEFDEYRKYFHDLKQISEAAALLTSFRVETRCDLSYLRQLVDNFLTEQNDEFNDWCFIDASYSDRVYRIDSAQEGLYNVSDILEDGVFLVKLTNPDDQPERKSEVNNIESNVRLTKAVIEACSNGNLTKLQEIEESVCSLTKADNHGRTPLHYAVMNNKPNIVEYIVARVKVESLNMVDDCGQTALHKAAVCKLALICTILVQAGADLSRVDYDGNTAAMIATDVGEHKIAQYLLEQDYARKFGDGQETSV